jgi:hypothetical protein
MEELSTKQIETLYKMYLRGLITFTQIVNYICNDYTFRYLKFNNIN